MNAKIAVRWVDEIDSTNAGLRALAEAGAPHGTALAARRQTAGRGRLGRIWTHEEGNLAISVLLRDDLVADRLPLLTLGAGVALAEVVREAGGLGFGLKWPNDLLDAERRKVAGVLCEAEWAAGRPRWVVVGLGVNVRSAPEGASCLADHGLVLSADALAARWVERLLAMPVDAVLPRWSATNMTIGRPVTVGQVTGTAVGLDPDGALRVAASTGVVRVTSGDLGFADAP